MFTEII